MEDNPRMQQLCVQHAALFKEMMDLVVHHHLVPSGKGKTPAEESEDGQKALPSIPGLVEQCKTVHISVLPSKTSGYKDMFPTVARLLLGEIMTQVFRQVDHEYIGCSKKMTDEVSKYIDKRVKTVAVSKAAHSLSRGRDTTSKGGQNNLRPNLQDFMRCALPKMCKKAESWKCQAALTNFLSTVLFSIVKGENCDYVDTLQLSNCELFKLRPRGNSRNDGNKATDEAGAIQGRGGGSELREGGADAESASVSEVGEEEAAAQKAAP